MRLNELFSSIATSWPVDDIDTSFPPSTDGSGLAAELIDAIEVEDVSADVAPDGTVAVTGKLSLVGGIPPELGTLVTRLFPSLRFRFAPEAVWTSDMRVSTTIGGGHTIQVDTLPLEVAIPPDLLAAHPDPAKRDIDPSITLSAGAADSVISRDFSLLIEADGTVRVQPHLPISIGPCRMFGLPATAVHDLSFIASPGHARAELEWLVRPLDATKFPYEGGGLGFGGIELDLNVDGSALKDVRERLHLSDEAEVVLEDIVIPSVGLPPVPQHGSFGVRRSQDRGGPGGAPTGTGAAGSTTVTVADGGAAGTFRTGDRVTFAGSSDEYTVTEDETLDASGGGSITLDRGLASSIANAAIGVRKPLEDLITFKSAPITVPVGDNARLFLSQLFFRTLPESEAWWTGLTVEGGYASDDDDGGDYEVELGLIDGDVVRLSFAHVRPVGGGDPPPVVHIDVWKAVVDIFRIRAGVSLAELGKESPSPASAVQALVDILIREKPGPASSPAEAVTVKSEDGKPFEAALVDVGWDRGKPSGNLVMPRGAELHLSRFALEVHEMGLVYEHGATYFSISGGIREKTSPLEGAIWFKRLRGKLAGNPDAPGFQLGGLGAELKVEDVVEITVHGMYRQDVLPDGTRVNEQGLGGGIVIHVGDNKWGLTVDAFWGERIPIAGDRTAYLLLMVALFGAIPMGPLELRGIEALYADSLLPKLEDGDREAGELKYYTWLKRARPTAVPESRGLEAWTPLTDAWALGFGLGVSITGAGKVFELKAFGLGFDSPNAAGLIIVVEFAMFGAKTPLAVGVFEYDFRRDVFVLQIQVDTTLDKLIDNFPDDVEFKIGGTITIGNKPGLIALGRLGQPDTWIGGKLEVDLSALFELKVRAAVCIEWLEDSHVGGGFVMSLSVKGRLSVIRLEGWGSLLVLLRYMLSGSNDFVARIQFEMGFAVVVFGFLRFGISVAMLAEWLAHVPDYFVFRVTFRFETPWYLPDVSYTLECTRGELEPAERAVVTSPLLQASSSSPAGTRAARIQRLDGGAGGDATEITSVNAMAGAGGAWRGDATPVPLDSAVEINFSVMVADHLGIGAINADLGEQVSGDSDLNLTARYALTGIVMRRRPVQGGAWDVVEELTGAASPRYFRWLWDADTRIHGQVAPKKLILNGSTPFTVALDNPLADAEILEEDPAFPCCRVTAPDVARFDFAAEPIGPIPAAWTRPFTFEGRGTVAPVRIQGTPCSVAAPLATGATTDRVGSFAATGGRVVSATASEDIAVATLRIAVAGRRKTRLVVVAFDAAGDEVGRQHVSGGTSGFTDVPIEPAERFRILHVTLEDLEPGVVPLASTGEELAAALIVDSVECITAADMAQFERDRERCSRESSDGSGMVVPFLPRHEYEIALTTEVGVKHSSTEWETTTVTERVAFVTSGPPGLNETAEPGLALTPYVVSAPSGGNGLTYREESVHIVLSDRLRIFGPGAGTAEADYRLPVTLVVESAFDSAPDRRTAKSSRESADWFLEHRGDADPWVGLASLGIVTALSRDPRVGRYQHLVEASTGTCEPDDVTHEQQPRIGVEPFDAAGRPLWDAGASYLAALRLAGSPVVEREPFEPADLSALADASGSWSVVEGALTADGTAAGTFGDATWDLLRLEIRGRIGRDGSLGAAVLVDAARPSQGIRALVRREAGNAGILFVESTSGVPLGSDALADVGELSGLSIEVFADAIRCRSGDASVSVERGDRGAGRCRVLATDASITALRVRGIDMYRLPFRTSRYEGFAEHIASSGGIERYDAGPAAEALASLQSRLGGRIASAMAATASAADREATFDDAASALAMPLLEDPERLHVTVANGGSDRWVLLESPEPIDFVEEVELALELRTVRPGLSPADKVRLGAMIEATIQGGGTGPSPFPWLPERIGVRARIPVRFPGPHRRWPGEPWPPEKHAFSARLVGRDLEVTARATGAVHLVRATVFSAADRELLRDVVVDLNRSLEIVRWREPDAVEWVAQPVSIIQNADATKALVLPDGAPLADGTYRMAFAITRRWFDTTDPLGPDNAYLESGVIDIELAG
jgi:hypothetical protein